MVTYCLWFLSCWWIIVSREGREGEEEMGEGEGEGEGEEEGEGEGAGEGEGEEGAGKEEAEYPSRYLKYNLIPSDITVR